MGVASCTKNVVPDTPEVNDGNVPFELVANTSSVKSTIDDEWNVSWDDNDIIYAVTEDGQWNIELSESEMRIINPNFFTYSDGVFTTTSKISDGEHTFRFMHVDTDIQDYDNDFCLSSGDTDCILPSIQHQDCSNPRGNISKYDVSAAKATVTTPTGSIGVTMTHLYSFMEVTLKNKTQDEINIETFNIKVDGKQLSGKFGVVFESDSNPKIVYSSSYTRNKYDEITVVLSNGTIPPAGELPVYIVMAPVTDYTGNITFTATATGGSFVTKTNSVSDLTFEAGTYNTAVFSINELVEPVIKDGSYLIASEGLYYAADYYHKDAALLEGKGIEIEESGFVKPLDSDVYIYDLAVSVSVVPTGKFAGLYTIVDKDGHYLSPDDDTFLKTYICVTKQPEDRSYWHISETEEGSLNIYSPWFSSNRRRLWCDSNAQHYARFYCIDLPLDSKIKLIPFINHPQIVLEGEHSYEVPAEGEVHSVIYRIDCPYVGESISVSPSEDWVRVYEMDSDSIMFWIRSNEGAERSCTVTISYKGAEDVTYIIHQLGN